MEEIWKEVKNYPDYQVSNLGNIKSFKHNREKILKTTVTPTNYLAVSLCKNGKCNFIAIHKIVAIAFLGHTPCGYKLVVNHKDNNSKNNCVDNLEIISQRENTNRKHCKSSSQYTGVSWHKPLNKWRANIHINGKLKHLGYFTDELKASESYQKALNNIQHDTA